MSLTTTVTHPLDPLTGDEISAAVAAVRAGHELERPTFSLVVLVDPAKDDVVAFTPGGEIARRAQVVVTDRATRRTYEAQVDLPAGESSRGSFRRSSIRTSPGRPRRPSATRASSPRCGGAGSRTSRTSRSTRSAPGTSRRTHPDGASSGPPRT